MSIFLFQCCQVDVFHAHTTNNKFYSSFFHSFELSLRPILMRPNWPTFRLMHTFHHSKRHHCKWFIWCVESAAFHVQITGAIIKPIDRLKCVKSEKVIIHRSTQNVNRIWCRTTVADFVDFSKKEGPIEQKKKPTYNIAECLQNRAVTVVNLHSNPNYIEIEKSSKISECILFPLRTLKKKLNRIKCENEFPKRNGNDSLIWAFIYTCIIVHIFQMKSERIKKCVRARALFRSVARSCPH